MLSIVMSGLQVSQKALDVTSNNIANAGTVGFKGSEASFSDVFANDPTTGSKFEIGSGVAIGAITRSVAQGQLQTTGNVTDLAIAGRGYFTMQAKDPTTGVTDTYYTRAGNFTINANGEVSDPQGNLLQCFSLDDMGNVTKSMTSVNIDQEKSDGTVAVKLSPTAIVGTPVTLIVNGVPSGPPQPVQASDISSGFMTFAQPGLTSSISGSVSSTYPESRATVTLPDNATYGDTVELWSDPSTPGGSTLLSRHVVTLAESTASAPRTVSFEQPVDPAQVDSTTNPPTFLNAPIFAAKFIKSNTTMDLGSTVTGPSGADPVISVAAATVTAASEFRGVFVQNIDINTKGMVQENYSDGSKRIIGAIALANFPNEAGLKPIGNTDFIASEASGPPSITQAGAPYAGDIHSGTLEESNIDITQELMGMLKAQQIYNGNARMMQTEVEMAQRITDKL